jgi:hypothetical protein
LKYIEIGIGNTWFIRTETELEDGTEFEVRGIKGPIRPQSVYIRIWSLRTVLILDSKEGCKKIHKNRNSFKVIFGVVSL